MGASKSKSKPSSAAAESNAAAAPRKESAVAKRKSSKAPKAGEISHHSESEVASFEPGREYRLVVLGQGGVGKTAITLQFTNKKFVTEYDPTIEDAYRKEYQITDPKTRQEYNIVVEIIDTAGQEDYSAGLHDKFIRQGHGFVVVYSIVSNTSFEKVKQIRENILWVKDKESVPMVLLANKADLEDERVVQESQGKKLAESWGCPFFETSAKTAQNVTESIEAALLTVARSGPKTQNSSRPV